MRAWAYGGQYLIGLDQDLTTGALFFAFMRAQFVPQGYKLTRHFFVFLYWGLFVYFCIYLFLGDLGGGGSEFNCSS